MKKYILVDLDNTLIDFNECARNSIITNFKKFGLPYREDTLDIFIRENNKIWKRHENGEIGREHIRRDRWNIIFKVLDIDFDGAVMEEAFEYGVSQNACPIDGAYNLLDYLKGKYKLYVASNGFRFVQENRLKIGDFNKYFDGVFVSEDFGFAKPSKEFFDNVIRELGNPPLDEILMIGDSISADIIGAENYGIDTVWFNKDGIENTSSVKSKYEVRKLAEIEAII